MAEKELETLKRKYAVARHQVSLLYKDYIEESKIWSQEKEALNQFIKKQNDMIAVDSVKLQEYDVKIFKKNCHSKTLITKFYNLSDCWKFYKKTSQRFAKLLLRTRDKCT